jgi:hypothetical protein
MLLKYFLFNIILSACLFAQIDEQNCAYNGYQLYGKVKIVEYDYDLTIEVVEHNADIDVKIVEYFPNDCCEWKMVEYFPDLKVKIVRYSADLKVRFVQKFPKIR